MILQYKPQKYKLWYRVLRYSIANHSCYSSWKEVILNIFLSINNPVDSKWMVMMIWMMYWVHWSHWSIKDELISDKRIFPEKQKFTMNKRNTVFNTELCWGSSVTYFPLDNSSNMDLCTSCWRLMRHNSTIFYFSSIFVVIIKLVVLWPLQYPQGKLLYSYNDINYQQKNVQYISTNSITLINSLITINNYY